MAKIDREWVRAQMQGARVKVGTGTMILKLMDTWELTKLSPQAEKEVVEFFCKLVLGHSITPEPAGETWVDARPGALIVGDVVRIKSDAFDGVLGPIHNGRRGVIVAVRYGDIVVRSTDGLTPLLDGTSYRPDVLQKRV